MLKKFVFLMLMFPGLAMAQAKVRQVVTMAVDDEHRPYINSDGEQPSGFYVQLLQRAIERLPGWELRLQAMPWSRALMHAERGDVDGLVPPYGGAKRAWMGAYAGPLFREAVVVVCDLRTGLGASARWPADYARRRIGRLRGYFLSAKLSEAVARGQVREQEFRNLRDALAALKTGQLDCVADDPVRLEMEHRQAMADPIWSARVPARLTAPAVLSSQDVFVGFSKNSIRARPELAAFAKALDEQLMLMRKSGEIDGMARKLLGPHGAP
ncbi:MAG TPA: ABC transporter substrate-binding protein [Burkholderiaceae bacterium]